MKLVIDIPKEMIISLEQGSFGTKYNMYDLVGCVMNGTSLTERPKGKWIKVYPLGMDYEAYMCSECKTGDWDVTIGEYKFCPYCGAEMSGGVEDEVSD